ncbi:MAG: dockerin type I repeat-containing protein [Ruminococcus sp.]|nr:dockerin type I repeat-containing protein [Ruminococcus sp.]
MKCKHKLISFTLVLILLLSTISSVSATTFNYMQNGNNQEYKMQFISAYGLTEQSYDYCQYNNILEYKADGIATTEEATPDYILSYFSFGEASWALCAEVIGDYVVKSNSIKNPYEVALFIFSTKENTVYTLKEAWDAQLPYIEEILNYVGDRIGDVNYDNVINIKDATLIQKQLADLEKIENDKISYLTYTEGNPRYISDYDRDGERTIKDATAIQKYIAGLEIEVNYSIV